MSESRQPQEKNTDQYDTILRAMEEGVLLSINNQTKGSTPSDELRVEQSQDDETDLDLTGPFGSEWKIYRDRRGELIYSKVTEDGLSYEDEIITLEIIGHDE